MSTGDDAGFSIDPAVVREWKRYPEYKDSGVEWLGGVPAGWDLKIYIIIFLTSVRIM